MRTAAIAKLKATLSQYLDSVKAGEEILITDRGKPIARITPVGGGVESDGRRTALVSRGIIRPGKGTVSESILRDLPAVNLSREDIERTMDQEREDRV